MFLFKFVFVLNVKSFFFVVFLSCSNSRDELENDFGDLSVPHSPDLCGFPTSFIDPWTPHLYYVILVIIVPTANIEMKAHEYVITGQLGCKLRDTEP